MTSTVVNFLKHHFGLFKAATSTTRAITCFATLALLSAAFLLRRSIAMSKIRNLLWPNYYQSDPNFKEPLIPDNVAGCPFVGCNIITGNKRDGPEHFYKKMSAKLKNPKIWSFYSFGAPVASIVGSDDVTKFQNMEFSKLKIMGGSTNNTNYDVNKESLYGGTNLMFETNKQKHRFLRGLVGSTMSPNALAHLVPTIQNIATKYINKMVFSDTDDAEKSQTPVKMETVCYDYTTEIVSKQILGFDDYTDEQIDDLQVLIRTWLNGMYSWLSFLPFIKKLRPAFQARQILTQKLELQVDKISNGKDDGREAGTTLLQNMIHAVHEDDDDEDSQKDPFGGKQQQTLTKEEVVQNTLLLVVAGTDNTTSTLVLLMLLLGLHPNVLQKLAKEQDDFLQSHPDNKTFTYNQLMGDQTGFPYLDAVVKEALRMGPVTGGFPRKTTETIAFDGYQIPRGGISLAIYG